MMRSSTPFVLEEISEACGLLKPAGDVHEVCHKARDATLEDDAVAQYDVRLVDVRLVRLGHDCTSQKEEAKSIVFICSHRICTSNKGQPTNLNRFFFFWVVF